MIDINSFKSLIGKKVSRFLIIVWPPFNEEKMLDIDMSIGFEFEDCQGLIFQIKIDKDDNWTPQVTKTCLESVFEWSLFAQRVSEWMNGNIDGAMSYEYYDATHDPQFKYISFGEILDIEFLTLTDYFNPFAIKIIFNGDYIILSPNGDGSTIETSLFNKLDNLENYKKLGNIENVKVEFATTRIVR